MACQAEGAESRGEGAPMTKDALEIFDSLRAAPALAETEALLHEATALSS
jgi:hypothetical protein